VPKLSPIAKRQRIAKRARQSGRLGHIGKESSVSVADHAARRRQPRSWDASRYASPCECPSTCPIDPQQGPSSQAEGALPRARHAQRSDANEWPRLAPRSRPAHRWPGGRSPARRTLRGRFVRRPRPAHQSSDGPAEAINLLVERSHAGARLSQLGPLAIPACSARRGSLATFMRTRTKEAPSRLVALGSPDPWRQGESNEPPTDQSLEG